ncbi:MAG: Flp pilus assembly complex ATPase component TadA [Candidatus Latescibacteria bacterium]|nr:Flp pilus assembly complex ATPase component TadA [Candidatus Latescibacterota bacterium]
MRTLTSILVESGIVTDAQVEQALARQRETGNLIGETLVELGFTSEENIGWALSKQLGIPYVDVRPEAIDAEEVRRFPEPLLRRVQAVPLFGSRSELTVAMADPTDQDAVAELKQTVTSALSLVIGAPGSIRRAIDSIYGPRKENAAEAPPIAVGEGTPPDARRDVVWDRAGTNFLLFHLHSARKKNASEIHFVPSDGTISVFYRGDAGLEAQPTERPEAAIYLRARLGVLGVFDLDGSQELLAGGSIPIEVGPERMILHVSHCRTAAGIATVIRLSPRPERAPELSEMGVSPIAEAEIREMVDGPEGLVIVHGPPRSGGSQVLSALAALAARPDRRMIALEPDGSTPYPDPVTRVPYGTREDAAARWKELVVGQGADVAMLDDVLRGESIAEVLEGASVGRLIFARTDWLDGKALLSFLARSASGRVVLGDRPFALLTLPAARREGSRVWKPAEERAASVGSVVLTDDERDAVLSGKTL